LFRTRETVAVETPAKSATSLTVTTQVDLALGFCNRLLKSVTL
jgi:hypothetical protein